SWSSPDRPYRQLSSATWVAQSKAKAESKRLRRPVSHRACAVIESPSFGLVVSHHTRSRGRLLFPSPEIPSLGNRWPACEQRTPSRNHILDQDATVLPKVQNGPWTAGPTVITS